MQRLSHYMARLHPHLNLDERLTRERETSWLVPPEVIELPEVPYALAAGRTAWTEREVRHLRVFLGSFNVTPLAAAREASSREARRAQLAGPNQEVRLHLLADADQAAVRGPAMPKRQSQRVRINNVRLARDDQENRIATTVGWNTANWLDNSEPAPVEMMHNTIEAARAVRQRAETESLAARREVEAARALEQRAETESLAVRREDVPIDGRTAEELFSVAAREALALVASFPNPTTTVRVDNVVAGTGVIPPYLP
jgi:hypothetical protein